MPNSTLNDWDGNKWVKITFEQFLKNSAVESVAIALEMTRDRWKKCKPLLVKYGFAQAGDEIKWGRNDSVLIHFAAP